jgi:hypothetical protein
MGAIAYVIGGGFAASLIAFPVAYLSLCGQFKFKFSNGKIAALFGICIPLVGFTQLALGSTDELSGFDFFVLLGVPLIICLAVVFAAHKLSNYRLPERQPAESIDSLACSIPSLPPAPPDRTHTNQSRQINRDKLQWLITGIASALAISYGIFLIAFSYQDHERVYIRRAAEAETEKRTGKPFAEWDRDDRPRECAAYADANPNDFMWGGRDAVYSRCMTMLGISRIVQPVEIVPGYLREHGKGILLFIAAAALACWLAGLILAKGVPSLATKAMKWFSRFRNWITS